MIINLIVLVRTTTTIIIIICEVKILSEIEKNIVAVKQDYYRIHIDRVTFIKIVLLKCFSF